jgi:hypothetical protein
MMAFFSSGVRSRSPTPLEAGAAPAARLVPLGGALAQAESASAADITKNTLKSVTRTGRPFLEKRTPATETLSAGQDLETARLQYAATMNVADESRQPLREFLVVTGCVLPESMHDCSSDSCFRKNERQAI